MNYSEIDKLEGNRSSCSSIREVAVDLYAFLPPGSLATKREHALQEREPKHSLDPSKTLLGSAWLVQQAVEVLDCRLWSQVER